MCGIALAMGHMPAAWDRRVWLARRRRSHTDINLAQVRRIFSYLFHKNPSCTVYCQEILYNYICIFIVTRYIVRAKCRCIDTELNSPDLTTNVYMIYFIVVASILSSVSLYYILFVVVFGVLMVIRKKDSAT